MKKKLLTELICAIATLLAATGLYSYLYTSLLGRGALSNDTLDVNIHDTYIVFERNLLILLSWLLLYVLVDALRQFRLKFKNTIANVMLIIVSLLLSVEVYRYIWLASMMFPPEGFTIYPPLSAIPEASQHSSSVLVIIFYSLWALEILLWSLVVLTVIMIFFREKQDRQQLHNPNT